MDIEKQLIRYITGELSQKEITGLERRLDENRNYREQLAKLQKIWNEKRDMQKVWNTDAAFERLKMDLQLIDLERSNRSRSMADKAKQRKRFGIRLFKSSSFGWMFRIAAILLTAGLLSLFIIRFYGSDFIKDASKTAVHEVVTERGHRVKIQLADGTVVNLNVESKLSYPNFFDPESRTVYLSGEAHFNVKSDDRPFFVMADEAVIEILGTAFNVSAYKDDDEIKVAVERGKVSLQTSENTGYEILTLEKGDLGTLVRDGSGTLAVQRNVDLKRYTGWLEDNLVFDDEPLDVVARKLERWYRVNIDLSEPELAERRLTATFQNAPLYTVLSVLGMSLELEILEVENGRVLLSAK